MTAILYDTCKFSGCPGVLLESSDGSYYLWNMISDFVSKIHAPTTLNEIIPKLADPDLEGMEIEELKEVD